MSKLPWTRYVKATGKLRDMNLAIERLANQVIEHGGWPTKVLIGRDWLDGMIPESFWLGSWGINAKVDG